MKRWLLFNIAAATPFVVAVLLGAPWWIVYGAVPACIVAGSFACGEETT